MTLASVVQGAGAAVNAAGNVANQALNSVADLVGGRIPAFIRCFEPPNIGFVPFDFNPDQIDFSRSASISTRPAMTATAPSPQGGTGAIVKKVNPPQISLSNIIIEGLTTKLRCDQLLRWMSPFSGIPGLGALTGSTTESVLPTVTFQWGPPMVAFMYDVRILNLKVSYVRFNQMGMPTRAKVNITMNEVPSLLASLPTNPTSGGLIGRRTHIVTDGDTLQSIATATYGKPGLWRRIAAVNGITNPSRLRPGTTVYLPNADELAQGGR
ncbi:MAG TPA: LysM domain-containing protein [Mycobacteriales bacterium]|nr:LysM domain-containing protein [Mycobacteriales bacterium]